MPKPSQCALASTTLLLILTFLASPVQAQGETIIEIEDSEGFCMVLTGTWHVDERVDPNDSFELWDD